MKVYNLNIDTSQPTNQVVQLQRNQTGMLSVAISNDGKYIRNLSCQLYDGADEISASLSGDNSFGFKADVGAEPKHVKLVAKSTPYESTMEYVAVQGSGSRLQMKFFNKVQIKPGVYHQDEFLPLLKLVPNGDMETRWVVQASGLSNTNFDNIAFTPWNPQRQIWFQNHDEEWLSPDTLISASAEISVGQTTRYKTGSKLSSTTYPSVGYWTDYQMDTLVNPSVNAPYDGNYAEPLKEVEVDGVKFVPTTLSVDGVEYTVLAEAQPTPEPEPEEPTTTEG